jgi:hypothetical protein
MIVLIDDGASSGFELTNNVGPHNDYGVFGRCRIRNNALAAYFPGALSGVMRSAEAAASLYPPDNFFPIWRP